VLGAAGLAFPCGEAGVSARVRRQRRRCRGCGNGPDVGRWWGVGVYLCGFGRGGGVHPRRYLVLEDALHQIRAIQPLFLQQQDLGEGLGRRTRAFVGRLRRHFPRFLTMRTLFVGCVAGAGHLSTGASSDEARWVAQALRAVLPIGAEKARASLIVLKEFPSTYRELLSIFSVDGYARIPSLPYVRLDLDFESFEDYMIKSLSQARRKNFRRKFKKLEGLSPIEMKVVNDLTPHADEVYPLYLQVYERAAMNSKN
jgi:predicted N-acyltransferase